MSLSEAAWQKHESGSEFSFLQDISLTVQTSFSESWIAKDDAEVREVPVALSQVSALSFLC